MRIHDHACMSSHTYNKKKGKLFSRNIPVNYHIYVSWLINTITYAPTLLEIYACAERSFYFNRYLIVL
jgi:hypothetical protein